MAKTRAEAAPNGGGAPARPTPKSAVFRHLAEKTGLSRVQVQAVFTELSSLVQKDLGKKGPGVFVIPGLVKFKKLRKPAQKARKGINPFTKQEQMFKARPARNLVKAQPLKALKDMV